MFNILIIEDEYSKLQFIIAKLKTIDGVTEDCITNVVDAKSAKRLLVDNFYDLLIVDIAIPPNNYSPVETDGGGKLIQEVLARSEQYKIPANIIGLTSKVDAFQATIENFQQHSIHVIKYSDTNSDWETRLEALVKQKISSKIAQQLTPIDYDYDVAIITAVEVEKKAILSLNIEWKELKIPNDNYIYYTSVTESKSGGLLRLVFVSAPLMGMVACGVLTSKIIQIFRPKFVFMPGIAASIKSSSEHGFGDILVVDESWDGGAGKIEKNDDGKYHFKPNSNHLRLDVDLSGLIRSYQSNKDLLRMIKDEYAGQKPNTELTIHIGSVVSVAGVVSNDDVIKQLSHKDRKLLGLEMEAYALYYACYHSTLPRPKAMVCKSISDFADSSKGDDFQPYSAYVSARFIFELIKDL